MAQTAREDKELTLCLIVKDEEDFLGDCLAATAPVCDDVVIVDTGSTDATTDIARSYTDRVYHYPMHDDFSAARNAALAHVRTEWVLFLDADERFLDSELASMRTLLAEADPSVHAFTVLRYNFFATGGFFTNRVVKLMRNRPHIRFRRRIAESVKRVVLDAGGSVGRASLTLNHVGHTRPLEARIAKSERYLALFTEHLAEHPGDARMLANVAMMLRALGRLDEALETSRRAVAMDPSSASIWYHHGHMLRATRHAEQALDAYRTAWRTDPGEATFANMVGVMQLGLGLLDEAGRTLERAAALDPYLLHVRLNQGLVRQARGEYAAAVELFEEVARRNPGFLVEQWAGRAEVDLFSRLHNETIVQYAGLGYHLAYCRSRSGQQP
jgi:tetratricopeptide (TPR) repeat protein